MAIHAKIFDKNNLGDPDSPLAGDIQMIASALTPLLRMDGGQPTAVARVRNMLNTSYPGKVTETSSFGPQYELKLNPSGDWCIKCTAGASFDVKINTATVVVLIEESTHY